MSTNYPEKLDSALIRPGRVDLQVEFTLATHDQIADIFIRMYTNTLTRASKSPKTKTKSENTIAPAKDKQLEDLLDFLTQETKLSVFDPEKVAAMAKEFAEQLPEMIFSPAEIQGYLLIRKTDPEGAVAGAGVWRDRTIEAKKKGKKVVTAQ
jgi:chaperone BCS1